MRFNKLKTCKLRSIAKLIFQIDSNDNTDKKVISQTLKHIKMAVNLPEPFKKGYDLRLPILTSPNLNLA